MNELNTLASMDLWQVFLGVMALIMSIKVVWTGFDFIIDKFGITTKKSIMNENSQKLVEETVSVIKNITASVENLENQRLKDIEDAAKKNQEIKDLLNDLQEKVDKIDQRTTANAEGTIELLRETIDQKCDYYINTLHGITSSDIEILTGLKDTYDNFNKIGIVANHKRQILIDKCLKLPVIADCSELEKVINED